jgi:hypothetical protein
MQMKQFYYYGWLLSLLACYLAAIAGPNHEKAQTPRTPLAFSFIENKGQFKDTEGKPRPELLYQLRSREGLFYYFAKDKMSVVIPQYEASDFLPNQKFALQNDKVKVIVKALRVDWELIGANSEAQVIANAPQKAKFRYFLDDLKAPYQAASFGELLYKDIYPGIDLKFYIAPKTGSLKYDFIVRPGANPALIQFYYKGAQNVALEKDGNLSIQTLLGSLQEQAPYAFQWIDGKQSPVKSQFVCQEGKIGFAIQAYDPAQPLVIDPTVFWSTYLGGSQEDWSLDMFVTPAGFTLTAGYTNSPNYPVSPGEVYEGGSSDGILSIFDENGNLLGGNFIGGGGQDFLTSVTVSSQGKIAVAGTTNSSNIPFSNSYYGGAADAFIMVFSDNGAFEWGRYYGGVIGGAPAANTSGRDEAVAVRFDSQQNVYLVGNTYSVDIPFPLFPPSGVYLQTSGGGLFSDFFIARFNAPNYNLFYATYYGGSDTEFAYNVDFSPAYGLAIGGTTFSSSDFPVTQGAFQAIFGGGDQDGFIATFNPNLARKFATFIGGANNDNVMALGIGANQRLVFAGNTRSANLSTQAPPNAFIQSAIAGEQDIYIGFLSATNSLQWLTYMGGQGIDAVLDLALSPSGFLTLVGQTQSSNFPALNAIQPNLKGSSDIIIFRFNPLYNLLWSTFYGGAGTETGDAIGVDANEDAYVLGTSTSADFPLVESLPGFDALSGPRDKVFIKLGKDCQQAVGRLLLSKKEFCQGALELLSITAFPAPGDLRASCGECLTGNTIDIARLAPGSYTVNYLANDEGCNIELEETFIVKAVQEPVSIVSDIGSVCQDISSVTLVAVPEGGEFEASCGSCVVGNTFLPPAAGVGEHLIRYKRLSSEGCLAEAITFIRVDKMPTITFNPSLEPAYCTSSAPITLSATPPGGVFTINGRPLANNVFAPSALAPGRYTIAYDGQSGSCAYVGIQNVIIGAPPTPTIVVPREICPQVESVSVSVTPAGGTLSGPGVDNASRTFSPLAAGPGTHTITYQGKLEGCAYQTSATITVRPQPQASISGLSGNTVCANAAPFSLNVQPSGGVLSITPPTPALQGVVFDPALAAPGVTYELTYSGNEQNCPYSVNRSLTVIAAPQVTINNLEETYCAATASPLILSATPPGGLFIGSGVSGNTLFLNLLPAGRYSLTYEGQFEGCAYSVTRFYTITPGPQTSLQIDAPSEVCEGGNVVLRPNIQEAGLIYSWAGPSGFITSSPILTLNNFSSSQAGPYELTVTYPGCTTLTAVKNISAVQRARPTGITHNSPICEGQTLLLSIASFPQTTYTWSGPGGFSAAGARVERFVALPAWAGNYTVRVVQPICQVDERFSASIVVQPQLQLRILSNAPVCIGDTLRLVSNAPENAVFYWQGPGGIESFAPILTIPAVQPSNAGVYSLAARSGVCPAANATLNVILKGTPDTISAFSNSPVCLKTNLVLKSYGAPASDCFWQGPDNAQYAGCQVTIPNMRPALAGLYTLTVNVPGCSPLRRTISVSAASLVLPPVLESNSPACGGTELKITARLSGNAFIFWRGPGGFIQNGGNVVSIPNANQSNAGVYQAFAVQSGCTSEAAQIEAKIIGISSPPVIRTNSPVCAGDRLSLSADLPPGSNYLWLGPNGFRAQTESAFIENVSLQNQGVYTLSTAIDGCPSVVVTAAVQILPAVALEGGNPQNLNLCSGDILQLRASGPPGAQYIWSGPLGFSATTPAISRAVSAGQNGVYILSGFVGGCTTQASVEVRVNARPAAPSTPKAIRLCQGATLTLSASFPSGSSALWQGPDGWSSNLRFSLRNDIQMNQAGIYTAVALQNGCTSAPATTQVEVLPLPQARLWNVGTLLTCQNLPVRLDLQLQGVSPLTLRYTLNGRSLEASNLSSVVSQWFITPEASSTLVIFNSITDGNGCTAPARGEVIIRQITPPQITIEPISPPGCGGNNGFCVRAASSSQQPIEYATNGGAFQGSNCFNNLPVGRYEVAVKQDFCISQAPYELKRGVMRVPVVDVSGLSYGGATINWTPVPGAISYGLRYRQIGAPSWIEVNNIFATSYTFSQLRTAREYEAQVRYNCNAQEASSYSESVLFTTLPSGSRAEEIISLSQPTLIVYPNPTKGKLYVQIKGFTTDAGERILSVYDVLGNQVLTLSYLSFGLGEELREIDLSGLPAGAYTLVCRDKQNTAAIRVALH